MDKRSESLYWVGDSIYKERKEPLSEEESFYGGTNAITQLIAHDYDMSFLEMTRMPHYIKACEAFEGSAERVFLKLITFPGYRQHMSAITKENVAMEKIFCN